MDNLEGKLEAVKMLKEEYGIGSQDAWNYLKAENYLSDLRKKYAEGTDLSVRALGNFLERAAASLLHFADSQSQFNGNLVSQYGVKHYYETEFVEDQYSKKLHINDEKLVALFGAHYRNMEPFTAFIRTLGEAIQHPEVIKDGQGRSLSDLIPSKIRQPEDEEDAENLKEARSYVQFLINPSPARFEKLDDYSAGILDFNPDVEAPHTLLFLYGYNDNDFYERAVNEHTLNTFETQRRIALSYLARFDSPNEKKVPEAIDQLRESICKNAERQQKYADTSAPQFIAELWKKNMAKSKYVLRAIISNRSWLEKVLSH